MSEALVRLQCKGQMVIPRALREEVGISEGAMLKVAVVRGGQLLVTPQFTIDRPAVLGRKGRRKQVLRELAAVVDEIRQEAKANARKTLSKKSTRPVQ